MPDPPHPRPPSESEGQANHHQQDGRSGVSRRPDDEGRGGAAPSDTDVEQLTVAFERRLRAGESLQVESLGTEFSEVPEKIAEVIQATVAHLDSDKKHPSGKREPLPAKIGRYQVARMLGAGSFGIVYEAFDDQLRRTVAIKVARRLPQSFNSESYLDEARFLAQLDHPGIVPVYDVGRLDDRSVYLVSKYVAGEDLAQRLRSAKSPGYVQTARIVAKVAAALANAHEHGVVHRDIKPSNILLTEDDEPVVADFGLAMKDSEFGQGAQFVGTPAYMSPEQARQEGHRVDGRADIYGLGAVFYEMLTGSKPFKADSVDELLDLVRHVEVRPPRQLHRSIPRELDRVCLKALAKRLSDRYGSAADMNADLEAWLATQTATVDGSSASADGSSLGSRPSPAGSEQGSSPRSKRPVAIVPRGLRSFEDVDADFFLELLPGPRDRDGYPECVRFWKSRICERDGDRTFAVGVLMGPSGSGKSSLFRAGVMPHLDQEVVPLLIETKADDTAKRVLRRIQYHLPALESAGSLREALVEIRRNRGLPAGRKLLLVFDQFEQWLSQNPPNEACELSDALRQCDGARLQAVLLTRDDFALAMTQFMDTVEQPLSQNDNFATIALFGPEHAKKVLRSFGLAFGAIDSSPNREQERFVDNAVEGLLHDGQLAPIQLALLAEMMRDKPWTPAALRQAGGTHGISYAFLREKLEPGPNAHPILCNHPELSRRLLGQLLPSGHSPIKGQGQTRQQLGDALSAWGDAEDIERVITALDKDLRLITAVGGTEGSIRTSNAGDSGDARGIGSQSSSREPAYQLAHDYLVPSIRDWIDRTERSTREGRTRLRLRELSDIWGVRPSPRNLPTLLEWSQIICFTRKRDWTDAQRRMMASATRRATAGMLAVLILAATVALGGWQWRGAVRAVGLRDRLLDADTSQAPLVIESMRPYRRWVEPLLRESDKALPPPPDQVTTAADRKAFRQRLHLSLAMAQIGTRDSLGAEMLAAIPKVEPDHLQRLAVYYPSDAAAVSKLKEKFADEIRAATGAALSYGAILASLDPSASVWEETAEPLADALLKVRPFQLPVWTQCFQPVRKQLAPALLSRLHVAADGAVAGRQRDNLLELLVFYLADSPRNLAEAISIASSDDLSLLLEPMRGHGTEGVAELIHLAEQKQERPSQSPPPATVSSVVQRLQGFLLDRGGIALRVPLENVEAVVEQLATHGYRPSSLRPYLSQSGEPYVAVGWVRDPARHLLKVDLTLAQFEETNQQCQEQGLQLLDMDACPSQSPSDGTTAWIALWVDAGGTWDTHARIDQTHAEFQSSKAQLSKQGYVAWRHWSRINHRPALDSPKLLYSTVWRRDATRSTDDSASQASDGADELAARSSYFRSLHGGQWGDVYPDFCQLECRLEAANHALGIDLRQRLASFAGDSSTSKKLNAALVSLQLGDVSAERVGFLDGLIEQRPDSQLYRSLRLRAAAEQGDTETLNEHRTRLGEQLGWTEPIQREAVEDCDAQTLSYGASYLVAGVRSARLSQPADAQLALRMTDLLERLLSRAAKLPDVDASHLGKLQVEVAKGFSLAAVCIEDPIQRKSMHQRAFQLLSLAKVNESLRPYSWQDVDFAPLRKDAPELTERWLKEQGWTVRCEGTWMFDPEWETHLIRNASIPEQLKEAKRWMNRGYLPVVVEAATVHGETRTTSLWRRTSVAPASRMEGRRELATVIVALAALGSDQWLLAALEDTHGLEVRNHVIAMCQRSGVPVERLVDAALQESRLQTQRNLCLALGQYSFEALPDSQRAAAEAWVRLLTANADPGVAQAAWWCANQWEVATTPRATPQGARWSTNLLGQVMVHLAPPQAVLLGSPYAEPGRDRTEQWMWHQIPRQYAIAATETTVAQFARFLESERGKTLSFAYEKSLADDPNCPQISVNWYNAARFCQWLSEEEGLPSNQWCYPGIWETEEEQWRLPADYLSRTGYRLPTEAEWEFACRGGALSSRSYGEAVPLLPAYAWHGANAGGRSHAVATRMPNDFGLFDMHGNVIEWCQETSRALRIPRYHFARLDREDSVLIPKYGDYRVVRGGDYRSSATTLRSGNRIRTVPRDNRVTLGFRITKTLSPTN